LSGLTRKAIFSEIKILELFDRFGRHQIAIRRVFVSGDVVSGITGDIKLDGSIFRSSLVEEIGKMRLSTHMDRQHNRCVHWENTNNTVIRDNTMRTASCKSYDDVSARPQGCPAINSLDFSKRAALLSNLQPVDNSATHT
jgi:hypothetical protein